MPTVSPCARSIRFGAGVSFIAVLVRTIPPPNPSANAPTTVPTPRKYDIMENGMACHSGCSVRNRTRESRRMFRCRAREILSKARKTKRRAEPRGVVSGERLACGAQIDLTFGERGQLLVAGLFFVQRL